jgi:hypothetical protein
VLAIFCLHMTICPMINMIWWTFELQKVLCELWMIMCFLITLICDLFFNLWEQSTGTFIAASRFGSATPVPPSVLSRGVGWLVLCHYFMIYTSIISAFTYWELDSCVEVWWFQGVGTLLDGLFGAATGSAASVYIFLPLKNLLTSYCKILVIRRLCSCLS